jgi:hypothetical protein
MQPAAIDEARLLERAAALERDPRVLGVQVWRAVPDVATSSEAKLRPGGDRRIEAALVVDVMREQDGTELEEAVFSAVRKSTGKAGEASIHGGTYQLLGAWRHGAIE